jgi:hypothetical protein
MTAEPPGLTSVLPVRLVGRSAHWAGSEAIVAADLLTLVAGRSGPISAMMTSAVRR